jgi:hypothetical protein
MTTLYVAASKNLGKWAAEVGLTKHVYKVGVCEGAAEAAVQSLNDGACAGQTDWTLVKKQEVEGLDEAKVNARLAGREKAVDPTLYPRLKGASGVFKVKVENVERHILVGKALAGEEVRVLKVKPADIALYLIANAQK